MDPCHNKVISGRFTCRAGMDHTLIKPTVPMKSKQRDVLSQEDITGEMWPLIQVLINTRAVALWNVENLDGLRGIVTSKGLTVVQPRSNKGIDYFFCT